MNDFADPLPQPDHSPFRTWGFWALLIGALGLSLVIIGVVGPMLDPKPSAGQQIGEIAGEIKRNAWRSFFGLSAPEQEPVPVDMSIYLSLAGPILGIVAIVLSAVSAFRRENWRFATYATSLGATAVLFQLFWYVALLIAGVVLLVTIIANIGDIFSPFS